jgi:hypothetical protein
MKPVKAFHGLRPNPMEALSLNSIFTNIALLYYHWRFRRPASLICWAGPLWQQLRQESRSHSASLV